MWQGDSLSVVQAQTQAIVGRCSGLQSLGIGGQIGIETWRAALTSIIDFSSNGNELWFLDSRLDVANQRLLKRAYISGIRSPFGIFEALPHLELCEEYTTLSLAHFTQRSLLTEEESNPLGSRYRTLDGRTYTVQLTEVNLQSTSPSNLFHNWEARIRDPNLWPKDDFLV